MIKVNVILNIRILNPKKNKKKNKNKKRCLRVNVESIDKEVFFMIKIYERENVCVCVCVLCSYMPC